VPAIKEEPMADQQNVGPTKLGKIVGILIILACLGVAGYYFRDTIAPAAKPQGQVNLDEFKQQQGPAEAPDTQGITTVSEYKYVPAERLPGVTGVSNYTWSDQDKTIEFPINVWIGWLPIVAANHGFSANEESIFFKNYGFKVNLQLIDDPVAARDAFAAGRTHILWGTLDMMVLFAPGLLKDSRTAPRIFQQIDWSNGGDGIVVRGDIKSVQDLKGKTIVYAQNSPSQYFINNLLLNAGIQPSAVRSKFTASAFEAAAAFVSDASIDACVSWAPDIYNIPDKVPGTRILTTTAEANKLIADVWAARADFARDHPEIIEGLTAGIFEGMKMLRQSETFKGQAFAWMADGYGMSVDDVKGMEQDAHMTNFAENKEFFLNQNNPASFERTWKNISFVYRELGLIDAPVRFDQVMDFSLIKKFDAEGKFADEKNEYVSKFVPSTYSKVSAEAPIITQTIRINFYPNSSNIREPQHDELGNPMPGTLYDPTVDATLETVGRLAGQYDRAVIAVVGHTDGSMKGRVPDNEVKKLSTERATAVKNALVDKFKFDPNKFVIEGMGWDQPADSTDPMNHALNRRVEISVYPPEQQ